MLIFLRFSMLVNSQCLATINDVRTAAPDLHKRHENAGDLAAMVHHLTIQDTNTVFRTVGEYQKWWNTKFESDDFFERELGTLSFNPRRPDPSGIFDAKLEGEKLVFFAGMSELTGVNVFRNEVDFSSQDWTPNVVSLPNTEYVRKGLNDQAVALFGGLVDGFVKVQTPTGDLLLSYRPEGDAAPIVWRNADKKVERFKDWKALVAKHPNVTHADVAKALAARLAGYLSTTRGLIEDAAEYKKEYETNNWGVENLKYWVNQTRVTEFIIDDWNSITDPVIKDGVLIAHFRSGRQPVRMTYELDDFAKGVSVRFVELATAKVISDTTKQPQLVPPQTMQLEED